MRLLIIEDEWLVACFIADIAMKHGIEVIGIAQSYKEAIHILESEEIDCAIVDINIKGSQHGIDVAHYLKIKNIKFFFLTAYKDMDTMQEAVNLKPLSYLIKPISEENLIAAFLIVKATLPISAPSNHSFSIDEQGLILRDNKIVVLSVSERIVLTLLIKYFKTVVTHEIFSEHLWSHPEDINNGTLRNIIVKLRKKFDLQIDNVKDMGYIFISELKGTPLK